jgi:hypothetical protein
MKSFIPTLVLTAFFSFVSAQINNTTICKDGDCVVKDFKDEGERNAIIYLYIPVDLVLE